MSETQISYYRDNINRALEQWSKISELEYEGKNYNIKFAYNFKEANSVEESEIFANIINFEGNNIALPSFVEAGNPRVENGNILIFPNIEKKTGYPRYWYSHELGHLMGLSHNYSKKSLAIKYDDDIMGYAIDQEPPQIENVIKLIKKLDLNKKTQIIKGDINNY